jgi:hypothetical protein
VVNNCVLQFDALQRMPKSLRRFLAIVRGENQADWSGKYETIFKFTP